MTVAYFRAVAKPLALGLALACSCSNPPTSAPTGDDDLATPAAAAFADLARNRFAVVAFAPAAPTERTFTDDNEWTVRLRAVPFVARVRLDRELTVADADRLAAQAGRTIRTPADAALAEALIDTLGPGTWRAGSEADVRAHAVFEDVGGSWRFRAFARGR